MCSSYIRQVIIAVVFLTLVDVILSSSDYFAK